MKASIVRVLALVLGASLFGPAGNQASTVHLPGRMSTVIPSAQDGERDHLLLLTLFFPETAAWELVEKMPQIDKADLRNIEPNLKKAYLESKLNKGGEFWKECFNRVPFQRFDVDADGVDDVICSGSISCGEGDMTIVWFGGQTGYKIRQDVLWPQKALRISPGNPPKVGSIEVGCCDSPYDRYFIGTLDNFYIGGGHTITKNAQIPRLLTSPAKFSARGKELVLRSSPESIDEYDAIRSEQMNNAAFGNILSKYLPGCGGTIIGKNKEGESALWYFVTLDNCGPLRTHSPYDVMVGWVEASQISLLEQSSQKTFTGPPVRSWSAPPPK